MPSTFRSRRGIDEGVDANLGVLGAQLLGDFRDLELLRPGELDDLHPLPLLHVIDDDLADHAVGERVVLNVHPQVVEEVRVPEATEVGLDDAFNLIVVGRPGPLRWTAHPLLELDVIEVGLDVDQGDVPLRLKAGAEQPEDRSRTGRGQLIGRRRRHVDPADIRRATGPLGRRHGSLSRMRQNGGGRKGCGQQGQTKGKQTHSRYRQTYFNESKTTRKGRKSVVQASLRPASTWPKGRYASCPASRYTSMKPPRRCPRMSSSDSGSST